MNRDLQTSSVALHKAHLHPQMVVAVGGDDADQLTQALKPLVQQVLPLAQVPPLPPSSVDTVFLCQASIPDPATTSHDLLLPLRPGGRLVLICSASPQPPHDLLLAWLVQAGLVNCLVFAPGDSGALVAVGAKPVPDVEVVVQENYSALADGQGSCCAPASGSSCCGGETLISLDSLSQSPSALDQIFQPVYTEADRQEIPAQAADFSLGCGNPTAFASLQRGETVLDIGSGGGLDSLIAARQVGPQGKVIGVDMTPAMLARARQAAAAAHMDNVEFRQGQAHALPVETASVDVILSNCVINLTADKGRVFQEAWRALRPGGRLEVSDVLTDIAFPPAALASSQGWSGCVTGALPEEEYVDLIQQAGFEQVHVRRSAAALVNGVSVYSAQVSARKLNTCDS